MTNLFYIKYQQENGNWRLLNSITRKFQTENTFFHIKEPKFDYKLSELPEIDKIKPGFYNVKISCEESL
jgi:hypothetical protein